ncbi:MAG: hypothetical protein WAT18_05020 [Sphingorhabdus sp.]
MDDRTKAAFDAASEAVKQVLALATGTIGAAIALFDDGATAGIDFGAHDGWLQLGLVLAAVSVLCGLLSLGAIAGQLGSSKEEKPSTYSKGLRLFHFVQLASYGLGIVAMVIHAIS